MIACKQINAIQNQRSIPDFESTETLAPVVVGALKFFQRVFQWNQHGISIFRLGDGLFARTFVEP